MLKAAEETYANLETLSAKPVNAALLGQLAAREPSPETHLARANLLRRMGDLAGAREAFAAYLDTGAAPAHVVFDDWSAVPAGLRSHGGYAMAPLIIVDNFLPVERMQALHAHACERKDEFNHAVATNEDAPPSYDPDRRRTLIDYFFTLERGFFHSFVEDNLPRLAATFGMPAFQIGKIELKLTNHVDGGFFRTHKDNYGGFDEAGRAITWLYYFGHPQPRFSGGDLYVLDSKPREREISAAWFSRVAAVPNRFVALPSCFYHAVGPTSLPSNRFEDGRFALSSHVRKVQDEASIWWEGN